MNKKIILPIAIAAMGFASCNGSTPLETADAAKAIMDVAVQSVDDIDNNTLKLSANITKGDIDFTHYSTEATSEFTKDKVGSFKADVENSKASVELSASNLQHFALDEESSDPINYKLKGLLKYGIDNLNGKFVYKDKDGAEHNVLKVDNLDNISETLYLNRITTKSNNSTTINKIVIPDIAYTTFAQFGSELASKFESLIGCFDLKDVVIPKIYESEFNFVSFLEILGVIQGYIEESTAEKTKGVYHIFKENEDKRTAKQLGIVAAGIAFLGYKLEENKEQSIENVKEFLEKAKKVITDLTVTQSGNALNCTASLGYEAINNLLKEYGKQEIFTGGTFSVTVSSDANKHVSNFTIGAKEVKTSTITFTNETKKENRELTVNDLSIELGLSLNYYNSDEIKSVLSNVPTSTEGYTKSTK